jgi:hypothetical protein
MERKMELKENGKRAGLFLLIFLLAITVNVISIERTDNPSLKSLLPEISSWMTSEAPQNYFPESLYEYINGAAEVYLSYDFKELIVAEFKREQSEIVMTVEIYDMKSNKNSFGIYSAERYPESRFIPVGIQGYIEEGTLNFLVDRYYVKLLCFNAESRSEDYLKKFSQGILNNIADQGKFPSVLSTFPQKGLKEKTEKYILNNFLGYGFLHDGYSANFESEGLEFDCFVIEGKDVKDAENMLAKYLEAKGKENVKKLPEGYLIKDRYYSNIYFAQVGRYLCGVMKIKEGFERTGESYLKELMQNLKTRD